MTDRILGLFLICDFVVVEVGWFVVAEKKHLRLALEWCVVGCLDDGAVDNSSSLFSLDSDNLAEKDIERKGSLEKRCRFRKICLSEKNVCRNQEQDPEL